MILVTLLSACVAALCAISLVHAYLLHRWPHARYSRAVIAFFYRRPKNLADLNRRHWLTRDEFAQVEKDFPNLISVTVISKFVEEPDRALGHAVLDNFGEGVKYSFFVSGEANPDDRLGRYRDWFKHLFDASRPSLSNEEERSFEGHFSLSRLEGPWDWVPYVFYTFRENGAEWLLPLKGSEAGVGLASGYARVAESEARTIISLVSLSSRAFENEIGQNDDRLVTSIPAADTTLIPRGDVTNVYPLQQSAEAA